MNAPCVVALVAALDANGLIGAADTMPWHIPEELKYFKRVTMGHPLVMGRKTFDSIGRVLPGRHTVVVTRDSSWSNGGVDRAASFADALDLARASSARGYDASEICVVGGAEIYALAMPHAARLYLTRVHARFEGDTWFPTITAGDWQTVSTERHEATAARPFAMTYEVLERTTRAARSADG